MIAFSQMGGTHNETPSSYTIYDEPDNSVAVGIGGDLRKIDVVRDFWQAVIELLESQPPTIWLNLSTVGFADTKLAACIVAILRRADALGISVFIVGSVAVHEILNLCKVPPLRQFTKTHAA